jgi:hypothetical protein
LLGFAGCDETTICGDFKIPISDDFEFVAVAFPELTDSPRRSLESRFPPEEEGFDSQVTFLGYL